MITTGSIFPFWRTLLGYLPVIVLLVSFTRPALAESEGLVKQAPITNNILPSGLTSEQLAAADAFADSGDSQNAIKTYRYIARSAPKSAEAPAAQFGLAKQLKQSGSFESAFKEYQSLLQKYPQTKNFEEAVADQIDIANAYLKGKKVKFLGIPLRWRNQRRCTQRSSRLLPIASMLP